MSPMPWQTAEELGRRLHAEGFRPLPDADNDGTLIGTRLWRVRAGYVEYLALRPNGLAQAVRAVAAFDYRYPAEHGSIVDQRSGHAINTANWLLATSKAPAASRRRPYLPPSTANEPEWPSSGMDDP
jgi:hypothetical protein